MWFQLVDWLCLRMCISFSSSIFVWSKKLSTTWFLKMKEMNNDRGMATFIFMSVLFFLNVEKDYGILFP